ncbi:hypothetical protein ACRALDRAFT_2021351 [Sodiomyces alcalophilus JCM 7366]|uniref:uncharacterized protein n=1 Tax=Sodiomyces alcalophilus JCM 7366 TaxID=591952 RepID=UPI0039B378D8
MVVCALTQCPSRMIHVYFLYPYAARGRVKEKGPWNALDDPYIPTFGGVCDKMNEYTSGQLSEGFTCASMAGQVEVSSLRRQGVSRRAWMDWIAAVWAGYDSGDGKGKAAQCRHIS